MTLLLSEFPKDFLAEFDPMRDEGNAYARKLVAAGAAVEHICHDGMIHNFHTWAPFFRRAGWCSTRSANKSASPSKIDSNFNQFTPVH
jgi:acetyl esterase/lipase